jgi:DNA-binding response OmpR family regulator
LIVEDHESIREGLASYLRQDGHIVETRGDGRDLAALADRFDLFILDVMLPGRDGFVLARELRALTDAPFLFLTARGTEADRIAGLEGGASDYIVKPFSPREVVLRVRGILGRRPAPPAGVVAYHLEGHRLSFDLAAREIAVDGAEAALTAGEWALLEALSSHRGTVLSRKDLMSSAFEYYVDTGERTIDTHIKNLRAKLVFPGWIETVRGFGYRFAGDPE